MKLVHGFSRVHYRLIWFSLDEVNTSLRQSLDQTYCQYSTDFMETIFPLYRTQINFTAVSKNFNDTMIFILSHARMRSPLTPQCFVWGKTRIFVVLETLCNRESRFVFPSRHFWQYWSWLVLGILNFFFHIIFFFHSDYCVFWWVKLKLNYCCFWCWCSSRLLMFCTLEVNTKT